MTRLRVLAALLACLPAYAASGAFAGEPSARFNYLLRCSGCHMATGEGLPHAGIPPFPGYVDAFAGDDEGRTYMLHVPGVIGSSLTDAEIAQVLNYVLEKWGDPAAMAPFSEGEVTRRRAAPVDDVVDYRRKLVNRLRAAGAKIADYPWP